MAVRQNYRSGYYSRKLTTTSGQVMNISEVFGWTGTCFLHQRPEPKAYVHIEKWRTRKLSAKYLYVYMGEIDLIRNCGSRYYSVDHR